MKLAKLLGRICEDAGSAMMEIDRTDIGSHYKAPGELVTRADRISHEIIRAELGKHFPEVPLVMEEQENAPLVPATCIVVDELDGTAIFANGLDEWGISIGYIDNAQPIAGAIHQPARNITVETEIGSGTWRNGDKVVLTDCRVISDCIVGIEINRFQKHDEHAWASNLARNSLAIRSLSTVVGNTVEFLSGNTSLYVNPRGAKVWDFAAAALAVNEAGGLARNCDGHALEWTQVPMSAIFAGDDGLLREALNLRA